jgi:hypothetical protein
MRRTAAPTNRGALVALSAVLLIGWGCWGCALIRLSPYASAGSLRDPDPTAWSVFFGALAVALFATFALAAYRLSFSLFASDLYRGSVARSCQHGLLWAVVLTGAAAMRGLKVLNLPAVLALAGLLIVGEIVILVRK